MESHPVPFPVDWIVKKGGNMDPNSMLQAVGSVGFPIVAFFYIVMRIEKKLEELTKAINDLELALNDVKGFVQRHSSRLEQENG